MLLPAINISESLRAAGNLNGQQCAGTNKLELTGKELGGGEVE